MTDNKIKVKTNESEIVEAIEYMYGISYKEANRTLEEGHYTREEIYKAIAWFESYGLPTDSRRAWAEGTGLQQVIETYANLF